MSRRTTIALVGGAIAIVAVIAAVIGIAVLSKHGPSQASSTSSASATPSKRSYGAQIVLPFNGLTRAEKLAVDSSGTVYVTDSGNNRVLKLAARSSIQEVLPFTGLNFPDGVAVDSAGTLYVASRRPSGGA